MNPEDKFPVGKPVPRIDSFEILDAEGPELTDEEKTWPVVALAARSDSFEMVESDPGTPDEPEINPDAPDCRRPEVVLSMRCADSATTTEVNALVEKIRFAIEGVLATTAHRLPVRIIFSEPGR